MTKIVSLHMEPCFRACENRSVCYHVNKRKEPSDDSSWLGLKERTWLLKAGFTVYESVCDNFTNMHWHLLKFYPGYNITMSCKQYEPCLDRVKDKVQLTIYNETQAECFKDYQKLFLVKDDETWDYFLKHSDIGFGVQKTHYIFEQKYMKKDKFRIVAEHKMLANDFSVSVDSCFTSFMVNGRCPYSYNNYTDITFDGTLRGCPYSKRGKNIGREIFKDQSTFEKRKEELFTEVDIPSCIHSDLFGGLLNVGKHSTSIPDNSSDN